MPKHTPKARLSGLVDYLGWQGKPEELADRLPYLISRISDGNIRDAMERFYGGGMASQRVDPVTGRPDSKDSRFYQHLEKGRVILKTLLSFSPDEYDTLRNMRGQISG